MRYYETPSRYEQSVYSNRVSITFLLIVINACIYVAQLMLQRFARLDIAGVMALTPADAVSELKLWQFVTYMFVHHPNPQFIFHILFNMIMLFMFGRELEWTLGRARYLMLYLACGIYAGLCYCLYGYIADDTTVRTLGASGAIYGLMTTYALFWPDRPILFFFLIPMKVWHCVVIILGIDLLLGVTGPSNVAHFAHLGGALSAFLIYKISPALEGVASRWETRASRRKFLAEFELRKEVDRILDKISTIGMQSLTPGERRLLDRASKTIKHAHTKLDRHE